MFRTHCGQITFCFICIAYKLVCWTMCSKISSLNIWTKKCFFVLIRGVGITLISPALCISIFDDYNNLYNRNNLYSFYLSFAIHNFFFIFATIYKLMSLAFPHLKNIQCKRPWENQIEREKIQVTCRPRKSEPI